MRFGLMFTIPRFFIFKLTTDAISLDTVLSAEIGQAANFIGLKSDRWLKSLIEISGLHH